LFLYLNRHCFNGLYRVNQKGEFNVPFGKYAAPYFPADEMRRFAEKANDTKAVFIDGDFRHTIPTLCSWHMTRLFTATPYIPASKTANFTAYGKPFTLDDHRDLVATLLDAHRQHGTRSVISNSDTPETREIYSAFNLHAFSVRRSVSAKSRDMAGEVIGVLRGDGCGRSGGGCPDAPGDGHRRNGGGIRRGGGILMNEPVWLAVDPAMIRLTIVTARFRMVAHTTFTDISGVLLEQGPPGHATGIRRPALKGDFTPATCFRR
jgi:hypothetical protein